MTAVSRQRLRDAGDDLATWRNQAVAGCDSTELAEVLPAVALPLSWSVKDEMAIFLEELDRVWQMGEGRVPTAPLFPRS